MSVKFEAIVAVDTNNGIAIEATCKIPWKSKTDMNFFRGKTINNIVVMGFKTLLTLPNEEPLKNRLNIVLTTKPMIELYPDFYERFKNIIFMNEEQFLNFLKNPELYLTKDHKIFLTEDYKIYLIGGKQVYNNFCHFCSTIWITKIKSDYGCDLIFPYDVSNYDQTIEYEDDELVIIKATPPNLNPSSF
jgi:dihydrofolate reductase